MAHHKDHIILSKMIKGSNCLRTDLTNVFMVPFTMRLLPGSQGVAVKEAGTQGVFNAAFQSIRVAELHTAVGKDQRHDF